MKLLILLAATLFGLGAFAAGASASCKTGKVTLLASSEAELMENAQSAGSDGCVTPQSSGVTECQIVPELARRPWIVVGQAPEGGGDALSSVVLEITVGQSCQSLASAPSEATDSRWVMAITPNLPTVCTAGSLAGSRCAEVPGTTASRDRGSRRAKRSRR